MAEFRFTFGTYAVASTLSVLALLLRTWYVHEELYTVVAVLTTQKVALAILYNFVFMLFVALGKVVLYVLLGQLRDLEVEQVLDSGRGFLLDTVLFLVLSSPTLDGADVSTYALAKFLLLVVALKTAHLVVQIQGATMFEVGHPRAPALVRVCVVLSALLSMDVFAVHFFFINASGQSTFYLWLLFECLGMLASCAICILKFGVHLVDLRLDNGWTSKSAVIFYLELMHDVTSLVIFLLFLAVFFITQPSRLPLYMTADIIHVVKALYRRILSLKKYRSLTRNLETRFPDATPEEVEAADTCIICRDFLFDGSKKLPCSHIFHIDCLRSWLVQQQSCPTCRADIPTDDTAASATAASRDGSESPAGRSRAPAAAQQQHRRGGSASRQQQQQDGGADASVFSGSIATEGSVANARHAATARDEKRRHSSEGHDSVASAPAADGASGAVEAVAGQSTRMAAVDVAANVQKSAARLNNAQVSDVADPLGLLDTRLRRSSGRLEAGAAAALAAAASTAAVAPSLRTSEPTSRRRVEYAEELEAALRLRVAQAEAVITGALAQALAMTYQMCDLYRSHASLWTIEAQRAQLEACYTLLQSSELRRSSPAATQAGVSVDEGIRRVPTPCTGASSTADPAADAPPLADTATTVAAGPARSVVASKPLNAEAEKHHQSQLATAEGASGIDAAVGGNEKDVSVSCPSVGVEGACGLQPTSSKDPADRDAGFGENSILVDQAALSSAGALPGALAVHESAEATSGDTGLAANEGETAGVSRRAGVGRGVGRDIRQNSGTEFVVVCPSHLFHQAVSPYFPPYNEMSVLPFARGADERPVDDSVRGKGSADGSNAAGNDIHSSPGVSISNSNRSWASAAAGSSSNVLLPEVSGTYGNVATAGQVSFCSPWSATPVGWQGLRGSAIPPPPSFATFSSLPGVLRGIGEALAARQSVERATSSPPAAAVEQSVTRASELSADVKVPPSTEYAGTVPPSHSMAARVASGKSTRAGREEEIRSHFGNSYTSLATDALMRAAAAGVGEETSRSSSADAAAFDGVTNAMAAELETLRKEQHRRWKKEGNRGSSTSDV